MLPDNMTLFELLLYARLGFKDFADDPLNNHYMLTSPPRSIGRGMYNTMISLTSASTDRILLILNDYLLNEDNLHSHADEDLARTVRALLFSGEFIVNGPLAHLWVERIPRPSLDDIERVRMFSYVHRELEQDGNKINVRMPIPINLYSYRSDSVLFTLAEYGIADRAIALGTRYSTINIDLGIRDNGNPSTTTHDLTRVAFDNNSMSFKIIPRTYALLYDLNTVNYMDHEGSNQYIRELTRDDLYPYTAFSLSDYWIYRDTLPARGMVRTIPSVMHSMEESIINRVQNLIDRHINAGIIMVLQFDDLVYDQDYYRYGTRSKIIDRIMERSLESAISHTIDSLVVNDSGDITRTYNDRLAKKIFDNYPLRLAVEYIMNKFAYDSGHESGVGGVALDNGVNVSTVVARAINTYYPTLPSLHETMILRSFDDMIWVTISLIRDSSPSIRPFSNEMGRRDIWSDVTIAIDESGETSEDAFSDWDGDSPRDEPSDETIDTSHRRYFTVNSYHSSSMRTNVGYVATRNFLSLPDEIVRMDRDYIGLELEFAHGSDEDDDAYDGMTEYANNAFDEMCRYDIGQDVLRHFDFSHDSSLNERGAEMVSIPMTLKYIKSKKAMFDHIFDSMRSSDMMELGGFHIHFGRNFIYEDIDDEQSSDLVDELFDVLFYDELHIDQRSPYGRARFSVLSTYILGRIANEYCAKNISFKDVYYSGGNHRNWINKNNNTVEFRMPSTPFSTEDLFLKLDYIVEGIEIIKHYMEHRNSMTKGEAMRDLRLHNAKYFKRKVQLLMEDFKENTFHPPSNTHINIRTIQRYFVSQTKVYAPFEINDIMRAYTSLAYVADALQESITKVTDFNGKIETIWDSVGELINMGIIEL